MNPQLPVCCRDAEELNSRCARTCFQCPEASIINNLFSFLIFILSLEQCRPCFSHYSAATFIKVIRKLQMQKVLIKSTFGGKTQHNFYFFNKFFLFLVCFLSKLSVWCVPPSLRRKDCESLNSWLISQSRRYSRRCVTVFTHSADIRNQTCDPLFPDSNLLCLKLIPPSLACSSEHLVLIQAF